jgi:hypothetical protein
MATDALQAVLWQWRLEGGATMKGAGRLWQVRRQETCGVNGAPGSITGEGVKDEGVDVGGRAGRNLWLMLQRPPMPWGGDRRADRTPGRRTPPQAGSNHCSVYLAKGR